MEQSHRIVARITDLAELRAVVHVLELAEFDRSQFGVLGCKFLFDSPQCNEERLGPVTPIAKQRTTCAFGNHLVDGLGYAGAIVTASSVVLAGGGLGVAMLATATTSGLGGLAGALVAHGFAVDLARVVEHKVDNGKLMLWIATSNIHQMRRAETELAKSGAEIVAIMAPTPGERSVDRRALARWDNEGGAVIAARASPPFAAAAVQ